MGRHGLLVTIWGGPLHCQQRVHGELRYCRGTGKAFSAKQKPTALDHASDEHRQPGVLFK